PWKKLWKGPLPPPRISPKLSVGDVLLPALQNLDPRRNAATSTTSQSPGHTGGPGLEPIKRSANQAPGLSFSKPNRRLVRPILVHPRDSLAPDAPVRSPAASKDYAHAKRFPGPRTYAEVVMAGGRRGEAGGRRERRGRGGHPGRHPLGPEAGRRSRPREGGGRGGAGPATGAPAGRPHGRPSEGAPSSDVNRGVTAMAPPPPSQVTDNADQGMQKRKRKTEASVKLECSICLEDHYTNRCPLLRGPKPTVAYCAAAEDGMGFFMIQQARPNQIVTVEVSEFAALVTVERGNVSAELLQSELARILPVQW
ncbi:hypothetical protein BS78_09G053700, partial [Paspalum vaginatum]